MPSQEELVEVWRYAYARSSFIEATTYCKILLENWNQIENAIKQALLTSLVISYARPFTKAQVTKSKRIVPSDESLVPQCHQQLHNEYMTMRNRVFGHKDATVESSFGPVNKIIIHVTPSFLDLRTASMGDIKIQALQQTIELCQKLIAITDQEANKFILANFSGENFPTIGLYEIDLEANFGNWLVKKS
jgi:hypothetical protein